MSIWVLDRLHTWPFEEMKVGDLLFVNGLGPERSGDGWGLLTEVGGPFRTSYTKLTEGEARAVAQRNRWEFPEGLIPEHPAISKSSAGKAGGSWGGL